MTQLTRRKHRYWVPAKEVAIGAILITVPVVGHVDQKRLNSQRNDCSFALRKVMKLPQSSLSQQ